MGEGVAIGRKEVPAELPGVSYLHVPVYLSAYKESPAQQPGSVDFQLGIVYWQDSDCEVS